MKRLLAKERQNGNVLNRSHNLIYSNYNYSKNEINVSTCQFPKQTKFYNAKHTELWCENKNIHRVYVYVLRNYFGRQFDNIGQFQLGNIF